MATKKVTRKNNIKHGAGGSRTRSDYSAKSGIDEKIGGTIGKSGGPAPSSTQERRNAALKGGGIVPRRKLPPIAQLKKTPHTGGGSAQPHVVKFHNSGDAANATTDTDHGTILYNASLRVVFWGREWGLANPPVTVSKVLNDVQSIITGPYLDGLQQYGVSKPRLVQTVVLDSEDPPNPFDKDDAGNRIKDLIGDGVFPEPVDDNEGVYAVFLPSMVGGKALTLPPDMVGYHSNYLNFDWGDFDFSYVHVAWAGNDGTPDTISSNFSHELVEALTDPDGSGWQVDPRSSFNWNEICDVCASAMKLNGVLVSSYWSSQDNACIIPDRDFTIYFVQWIWRPSHIEWLGGVDENGNAWQFPRQMVMDLIHGGDQFKVDGAISGKESTVGIYYLDARHPYLATNTDGVPDDNLLALPQRRPS